MLGVGHYGNVINVTYKGFESRPARADYNLEEKKAVRSKEAASASCNQERVKTERNTPLKTILDL